MKILLRHYLAGFFSPTALTIFFLVIGSILLWRKKDFFGKLLVTLATGLLLFLSLDPLNKQLIEENEEAYVSFDSAKNQNLKFVVVLGGSILPRHERPLSSQLTQATLVRLVEGIRIHREIPGSLLVVSGKGRFEKPEAEAMREMALLLGVKNQNIIIEVESNNTRDHTLHLKKILKDEPFALVTSASHMPRASALFSKAGYKFIPAPTDHFALNKRAPFPKGANLAFIDMWVSELLGKTWSELNDEI